MRTTMLGAVKGDGAEEGIPLFRVLARRWKSFAPVRRERAALASLLPSEDEPKPTRVWISKPRHPIYAQEKPVQPKSKRSWNPWLWLK